MPKSDYFTRKNPPRLLQVDHETGMMHVPGIGPVPLIGPTSGRDYEQLKRNEAAKKGVNQFLIGIMKSSWQCSECHRIWTAKREEVCTCSHFFHDHPVGLSDNSVRVCQICSCRSFKANGEMPLPGQLMVGFREAPTRFAGPESLVSRFVTAKFPTESSMRDAKGRPILCEKTGVLSCPYVGPKGEKCQGPVVQYQPDMVA